MYDELEKIWQETVIVLLNVGPHRYSAPFFTSAVLLVGTLAETRYRTLMFQGSSAPLYAGKQMACMYVPTGTGLLQGFYK